MLRLLRRYIFAAVICVCLFWLIIDLALIQWQKDVNNENETTGQDEGQIDQEFAPKEDSLQLIRTTEQSRKEHLVTIDYFKQFYVYSLNPQPGSAGMEGAAVKNADSEKEREQLGFKNYSFNELASSKISLERSIPENRDKS